MSSNHDSYAHVDKAGRLVLPPELAARHGIEAGTPARIDEVENGLYVRRGTRQLAKLYVEPTNQCNLDCRTCIRNIWNAPLGKMSAAVFDRVLQGLRAFSPPPTVCFGGFGEPLFHPKIVEMVRQVKALGARVELTTNGTRLTPELSRQLIAAGIDLLWVSLDGATPESYADVRLGAALPQVLENIAAFDRTVFAGRMTAECGDVPARVSDAELGLAFVAMKRNIAELPALIGLGQRFHARHYMVTNVLPYTPEMRNEVLYFSTLTKISYLDSAETPRLSLPRMDENAITRDPLYQAKRSDTLVTGPGGDSGAMLDRCPFVESGAAAVGWDGSFSPCLPLLYDHTSYVVDRERHSRHWSVGNVKDQSLPDLWSAPELVRFRERVQAFRFPPCTVCGGCDLSDTNERDCLGNSFPTCGGCLWAKGLIQCP